GCKNRPFISSPALLNNCTLNSSNEVSTSNSAAIRSATSTIPNGGCHSPTAYTSVPRASTCHSNNSAAASAARAMALPAQRCARSESASGGSNNKIPPNRGISSGNTGKCCKSISAPCATWYPATRYG